MDETYKVVESVNDIPDLKEDTDDYMITVQHVGNSDITLASLNLMRETIQELIDNVRDLPYYPSTEHSLQHLAEARMWYGFCIQELKNG